MGGLAERIFPPAGLSSSGADAGADDSRRNENRADHNVRHPLEENLPKRLLAEAIVIARKIMDTQGEGRMLQRPTIRMPGKP